MSNRLSNLARVYQDREVPGSQAELTVIIPTLDEAPSIGGLIKELLGLYPGSNIIVVDDDSSDGTPDIVRRIAESHGAVVRLLARPAHAEKGITASVMEGVLRCRTEYFAVMDADFQHPPEVLGELFAELQRGADLVVGSRLELSESLSPHRILISKAASALARQFLRRRKVHVHDPLSGIFAGRTNCFKSYVASAPQRFERRGYKVLFDLLKVLPASTSIHQVNYSFRPRPQGNSKLRAVHGLYFLRSFFR